MVSGHLRHRTLQRELVTLTKYTKNYNVRVDSEVPSNPIHAAPAWTCGGETSQLDIQPLTRKRTTGHPHSIHQCGQPTHLGG